jgi:hypothetical protein
MKIDILEREKRKLRMSVNEGRTENADIAAKFEELKMENRELRDEIKLFE